MFIVSLPYAVLHGGYWAITAMVGIAYICCYTGKILVDCLYEVDESGQLQRVRNSYKAVARAVFGKQFGGEIVQTAQVCFSFRLNCRGEFAMEKSKYRLLTIKKLKT